MRGTFAVSAILAVVALVIAVGSRAIAVGPTVPANAL
jgi:hypothetical protein